MSTIKDLAFKLITISGNDVYSLLKTIKELSTSEASAKIRSREQKYAAQAAWKRANTQYQQVYKTYRAKFTRHK